MLMVRCTLSIVSLSTMIVAAHEAVGQAFPTKPLRVVVSAPGGSADFEARLIAPGLSDSLGQPVIVDNRSGIIPQDIVTKALPDGHTVVIQGGSLWIATLLQQMSYDPVKDVAPISLVSSAPNVLVVHPTVPANSVKDLIALAKAKPGVLNYSSSTGGTSTHLAAELFKAVAGVDIVRIPYKGSAAASAALLAGEVQLLFGSLPSSMPHVKSGKLKALAVTSAGPSALAPGLPTVAASGLPSYTFESVDAMFAPAKTPVAIIKRLNQELIRSLNQADIKEKFLNSGVEAVSSSPEQLAELVRSEMAAMGKVIKNAGIRAD